MLCSYAHSSDELIHRLHIYDFTPYEDTFSMKIKNFSNQVTQLFKTQKLPFKAGEQPFHMEMKDSESNRQLFSNTEPESFIQQNGILKNTKEHVYQYLYRFCVNEKELNNINILGVTYNDSKLDIATLFVDTEIKGGDTLIVNSEIPSKESENDNETKHYIKYI